MWLLALLTNFLSATVVTTLLFISLLFVVFVLLLISPLGRLFVIIKPYTLLIYLVTVILLSITMYVKGQYDTELNWKQKVAEVEKKLALAEEKSKTVNNTIETKVITKTKIVKERGAEIVKYIDREITVYDEKCEIPQEFINIHNNATELLPK